MTNLLLTFTRFSLIAILILSTKIAVSQNCNYELDFKNETSFQVDCYLPTGSSHTSASQWEVKGTNQGPAHCSLEANLDFNNCAKSDLIVDFRINRTGSLAAGDFITVQINTDRSPAWVDMLFLDDIHMNSLGNNVSDHQVELSSELYDDMNELRVRLVIYSTGNGSPIKIKDGDFSVNVPSYSLPLDLVNFEAETDDQNVTLAWETTQEEGVSHFELERSFNTEEWTNVVFLTAQNTSNANYKYQDKPRTNGTVYYRLKMVDQDETITYSKIISTRITAIEMEVYPNPATDRITVATSLEDGLPIQIFNLMGRLVKEEHSNNPMHFFDISDLPTGNYLLKVGDTVKQFTKVD